MSEAMKTPEMIYTLIPAIMADISAIGKDKKNVQQGFKFRGIDDVMNVMKPILAKHQVFVVPEVLEQTREESKTRNGSELHYSLLRIRFRFFAPDGSFVEAVTLGEGMDSGDKASNKAMSIAFKYALFQVFCIPTEEMDDPDAEDPTTEPRRPASKPAAVSKGNAVPSADGFDSKTFLITYMNKEQISPSVFAQRRQSLISSGIVPDVPSDKLTEQQAVQLVAAMEANFGGEP